MTAATALAAVPASTAGSTAASTAEELNGISAWVVSIMESVGAPGGWGGSGPGPWSAEFR